MVRIKYRYLLLNILFPEPATNAPLSTSNKPYTLTAHAPTPPSFNAGALVHLIRDTVSELFGDYGVGVIASGLKIPYFSPATGTAIVRCPRASFRLVWAAMTFMGNLPGRGGSTRLNCVMRVVRVSGTIRKAEEEVIRRARRDIVRVRALEEELKTRPTTGTIDTIFGAGQQVTVDDEEIGIEDFSGEEDEMDDDSG